MSFCFFNLRIGLLHFQILRGRPWVRLSWNLFHRGRLGKESPWVELYR